MRARYACLVPVLALGALVGCSDTETGTPPGVEFDTGTADTGTPPKDSTVTDTGMPEDTNPEDTGSPDDTADTATPDVADTADTAMTDDAADSATIDDATDTATIDDATDSATEDTADSATEDTADAAAASDTGVADSGDAATDSGDAAPSLPSAEVWVTRVGSGTALASGVAAPVFIDKFQLSTLVRTGTIAMPTSPSGSNYPLTLSSSATSEGHLARSFDGKFVTLGGYGASPGTTGVVGTSTTGDPSTLVLRVIGRVNAADVIDTSTTTTSYSGNSIRSVTTTDGSVYWLGGVPTGLSYLTPHGSSATAATLISTGLTNVRVATIFEDGTLWGSTNSGSTYRVFNFGSAERPTVGTTPVAAAGVPTSGSPYGIAGIAAGSSTAVDTVYVCDDGAGEGIHRYKLSGSTFSGTKITSAPCRGLAVTKSGTSVLVVAVTNDNRVIAGIDTLAGVSELTTSTVATGATNTAFRGVAFAPAP